MGRAKVVADSDSSEDDLLARPTFDGFEIRIKIVPQKRHADDGKRNDAKKQRSGTEVPDGGTKWKCGKCGNSYSNRGNLVRHEKKAHPFESECKLCDLEYSCLDKHYGEHHCIEYVKYMLFDDGKGLVSSAPNTENGEASWFLSQKQKAEGRLSTNKCRLCELEIEFANKKQLQRHYTTVHKVDKDHLGNVEYLFRMEKGAHLKSDGKDGKRMSVPKNQKDETFNKCSLCGISYNPLSKHYGFEHGIDDVEDMLFKNGNVLIISSADTKHGTAPWFLNQKKIAEQRLNNRKCRLCIFETEFSSPEDLERHYTNAIALNGHRVDPNHLWKMEHLFRKEKNAHLKENSDRSDRSKRSSAKATDNINKSKKKVDDTMSTMKGQPNNVLEMGLITYICKCGAATETNDASIDHAQKHVVCDYAPTVKKCPRCDLTFEEAWFEDHVSRHSNGDNIDVLKTIVYDYTTLLSDKWFDMFNVLSDAEHVQKIVASSVYKYTRSVKMTWNVRESGVPLYQCETCMLFIDPAKVKDHIGLCSSCENEEHYCSECDIFFSTSNALKRHEEDHKAGSFRVVTFNRKTDLPFNKALMQHQQSSEDVQESNEDEEVTENPKRPEKHKKENNFDNKVMKFCNQCKRSVKNFDAHIADHKNDAKKRMDAILREENMCDSIGEGAVGKEVGQEKQVCQSDHSRMDTDVNVQITSTDKVSKECTNKTDNDVGGTVTPWESDSDSESIHDSFTMVHTQAQINMRSKDNGINNMEPVFYVNSKGTPGDGNNEDVSEAIEVFNDLQVEIGNNNGLVIDNTSKAHIQAEAHRVENDNDINETQPEGNITPNKNNQQDTYFTEAEMMNGNYQDTNEMNFLNSPELYLGQLADANENDTEVLGTGKDDELQSTQDLLDTLGGTGEDTANNKEARNPNEVTQDIIVTRDIAHLLPIIRQLTAKYLMTKQQ